VGGRGGWWPSNTSTLASARSKISSYRNVGWKVAYRAYPAGRSAGATASMNPVTLAPCRRTRHAPTTAASATAPQMPSPPSPTAKIPYQWWGMYLGVVMSK
jgi:hypothetical protein